ncbi:hypothetical protein DH2020_022162 [Rehmannia glutinosa]|uniref:Uncharacterized protein n=1 Tax=Rehmannia glutinosa TaxID=99300 RepID=A0ABR0WD24_REHGL
MVGDVVRLEDEKAELAAESLRDVILADQRTVKKSSYSVSGILSSSYLGSTSRSANLQELLQGNKQYSVYRFNLSSCMYIDGNGEAHEVNLEDIEKSKADPLDRKGFDVLGKVLGSVKNDGSRDYRWKELRFTFKGEARDVETFCQHLLEMEEEALKKIDLVEGLNKFALSETEERGIGLEEKYLEESKRSLTNKIHGVKRVNFSGLKNLSSSVARVVFINCLCR